MIPEDLIANFRAEYKYLTLSYETLFQLFWLTKYVTWRIKTFSRFITNIRMATKMSCPMLSLFFYIHWKLFPKKKLRYVLAAELTIFSRNEFGSWRIGHSTVVGMMYSNLYFFVPLPNTVFWDDIFCYFWKRFIVFS